MMIPATLLLHKAVVPDAVSPIPNGDTSTLSQTVIA